MQRFNLFELYLEVFDFKRVILLALMSCLISIHGPSVVLFTDVIIRFLIDLHSDYIRRGKRAKIPVNMTQVDQAFNALSSSISAGIDAVREQYRQRAHMDRIRSVGIYVNNPLHLDGVYDSSVEPMVAVEYLEQYRAINRSRVQAHLPQQTPQYFNQVVFEMDQQHYEIPTEYLDAPNDWRQDIPVANLVDPVSVAKFPHNDISISNDIQLHSLRADAIFNIWQIIFDSLSAIWFYIIFGIGFKQFVKKEFSLYEMFKFLIVSLIKVIIVEFLIKCIFGIIIYVLEDIGLVKGPRKTEEIYQEILAKENKTQAEQILLDQADMANNKRSWRESVKRRASQTAASPEVETREGVLAFQKVASKEVETREGIIAEKEEKNQLIREQLIETEASLNEVESDNKKVRWCDEYDKIIVTRKPFNAVKQWQIYSYNSPLRGYIERKIKVPNAQSAGTNIPLQFDQKFFDAIFLAREIMTHEDVVFIDDGFELHSLKDLDNNELKMIRLVIYLFMLTFAVYCLWRTMLHEIMIMVWCSYIVVIAINFGDLILETSHKFLLKTFFGYLKQNKDNLIEQVKETLEVTKDQVDQMNKVVKIVTQSEEVIEIIKNWNNYLTLGDDTVISDQQVKLLIEAKSLLLMVFYLYMNQKVNALMWATNFPITRSHLLIPMLKEFPVEVKFNRKFPGVVPMKVKGQQVLVTDEDFNNIAANYESGIPMKPQVVVDDELEVHAHEFDFAAGIFKILGLIESLNVDANTIRKLNEQQRYAHGKASMYANIANVLQYVVSMIGRTYFSIDPFDPTYMAYVQRVVALLKNLQELCVVETPEKLFSQDMLPRVNEAYQEIDFIKRHPRFDSLTEWFRRECQFRFKQFEDLYKDILSTVKGSQFREIPVCVCLTGKPGVGKSSFMEFAMKSLTRIHYHANGKEGPAEFRADMCYYFNGVDKFTSGYHQQYYVVVDDAFQSDEKEDRRAEAIVLIHMVNQVPFLLNMPGLDEKGRNFFNSWAIFVSTNLGRDGEGLRNDTVLEVGITNPQALKRRFHLIIHRTELLKTDVHEASYRIDQCLMDPTLEGKEITATEIVHLIQRTKEWLVAQKKQRDYTPEDIDEIFDLHEEKDPSWVGILSDLVALKVYQWWNSPSRNFMLGFCALICLVGVAYPWLSAYLKPKDVFSMEAEKFEEVELHSDPRAEEVEKRQQFVKGMNGRKSKSQRRIGDTHGYKGPLSHGLVIGSLKTHSLHEEVNVCSSAYMNCCLQTLPKGIGIISIARYDKDPRDPTATRVDKDSCQAWHFRDRFFGTCAHVFTCYIGKPHVLVRLVFNDKAVEFPLPKHIYTEEETDLAIIKGPSKMDQPMSLKPYFLKDKDITPLPQGHPINMMYRDMDGNFHVESVNKVNYSDTQKYLDGTKMYTYVISTPICYFKHSKPGQSGALNGYEDNGRPVIFSQHVGCKNEGERKGTSISLLVTAEMVEEIIGMTEGDQDLVLNSEHDGAEELPFPLEVFDTVPVDKSYYFPRLNPIKKTCLFGIFGAPTRLPADMRKYKIGDKVVDPYHESLKKLMQEDYPPFNLDVEACMNFLHYWYPDSSTARLFEWEECLVGLPDEDVNPVDLGTSSGYPWCLGGQKGKYQFVEPDNPKKLTTKFLAVLNALEEDMRNGKQITAVFLDLLKVELRKLLNSPDPVQKMSKVHKPRLFCGGPFHLTMLTRRYFLAFGTYVQKSHGRAPIKIGINVHDHSWTILYDKLNQFQNRTIGGDFKNWDGRIPSQITQMFCEFVNRWYNDGPINARVRELIVEHITNTTRLYGNKLYKTKNGMPSGHGLTALANSFNNLILNWFFFHIVMGMTVQDYALAVYGDDLVATTDNEKVTLDVMAKTFEKFGMTFTHWSKEEGLVYEDTDTLDDIKFLGRSFKSHGLKLAPLPLPTILETIYWYIGPESSMIPVLTSKFDAFCNELFHHGPRIYEIYTEALRKHLRENYPQTLLPQFETSCLPWGDIFSKNYGSSFTTDMPKLIPKAKKGPIPEKQFQPTFIGFEAKGDVHDVSFHNMDQIELHSLKDKGIPAIIDNPEMNQWNVDTVEPTPSRFDVFGKTIDSVPVGESASASEVYFIAHQNLNQPYVDMSGTADAEIPIGPSLTWNTSDGVNTLIATYFFPLSIMSDTRMTDRFKYYKWMRAGFSITATVIAQKNFYGTLIMGWIPDTASYSTQEISDMALPNNLSGRPHVLLNAATADSMTLKIPCNLPRRYFDIVGAQEELGRVYIRVIAPLRRIDGVVDSCKVNVVARFLEPEFIQPFTTNSLSIRPEEEIPEDEEEIQPWAWRLREVPLQNCLEYDNLQLHSMKEPIPSEQMMKSAQQLVAGVAPNLVNVAGGVYNLAMSAAPLATTMKKGVQRAFGRLGGDKPLSLEATGNNKIDPYKDDNTGRGLSSMPVLGIDPANAITTKPVASSNEDETSITRFIGVPMIVTTFQITSTTTVTTLADVAVPQNCYLDYIRQLFAFSSGTTKYMAYINASTFHDVQLVLWMATDVGQTVYAAAPHIRFTVRGPTVLKFSIPFQAREYMQLLGFGTTLLKLTMINFSQPSANCPLELLLYKAGDTDWQFGGALDVCYFTTVQPVTTFVVAAKPPAALKRAQLLAESGKKLFKATVDTDVELHCDPRAEFSMPFEPMMKGMTAYHQERIVIGEDYHSLLDWCKVMQPYFKIDDTSGNPDVYLNSALAITGDATGWYYIGLEMIGKMFDFHRGSIRVRLMQGNHDAVTQATQWPVRTLVIKNSAFSDTAFRGHSTSSSTNPLMELQVPYLTNWLMEPTGSGFIINKNFIDMTDFELDDYNNFFLFKAAGDDFSFHGQKPLPAGSFKQIVTTQSYGVLGYAGLVYYNDDE